MNFMLKWIGLIVNLITLGGFVVQLIKVIKLYCYNGGKLPEGVSAWPFIMFLSLGVVIVINIYLFGKLLKSVANNTVDYKVICDKLPEDLQKEIENKDKASPYVGQAVAEFCSSLDEEGFKKLLNSPDVTCKNIRAGSKLGKTILQCSFIPIDEKGNTIIIRRRGENHASIFKKVKNWRKQIYSFISFSPIPDGYDRKFDSILNCYAHEVPLDGVKLDEQKDFKFVGVIYNRRGGGPVNKSSIEQKKNKNCIRYLFVVYLVKYSELHFINSEGNVNWEDIDLAFAETYKRGSKIKDRFFLKDHDYIVGADSVIEIASRLTVHGSEEGRRWLKVEQEALRLAKHKIVDEQN